MLAGECGLTRIQIEIPDIELLEKLPVASNSVMFFANRSPLAPSVLINFPSGRVDLMFVTLIISNLGRVSYEVRSRRRRIEDRPEIPPYPSPREAVSSLTTRPVDIRIVP